MGGASGLKTFKNYPTRFRTWALLGQAMLYDGAYFTPLTTEKGYAAIIDTGNS